MKELFIPPDVAADAFATEALRMWISGGKQHVSVEPQISDDPAAWGIILVDIAKHIAAAYQQRGFLPQEKALARLKQGFDAEWDSPTA